MAAPSIHPFRTALGCIVLFVVLIIKVAASLLFVRPCIISIDCKEESQLDATTMIYCMFVCFLGVTTHCGCIFTAQ